MSTTTKTWFITGAASGLGRAWTQAALERGDAVVATARRPAALDDLRRRHGDRILPLALDVTDRDAAFATVREGARHFGSLDVVVNSAGYGHFGMVEELAEAEIRAQLETNLLGALWVTQAALPILRAQGSGHVIQVSSEGGVVTYPGIGAYHASKWALEGLTQTLTSEVGGFGIAVTLVEPGPYATNWLDAGTTSAELAAYAPVREAGAQDWQVGDVEATRAAILTLVDAEDPPLRLVLGRGLPAIEAAYAERLAQWREWAPVSEAASGHADALRQ